MTPPDILAATGAFVEALERFDIDYFIGGSVASSFHGLPRSTLDVDLVADLRHEHVEPLVDQLQDTFYIDAAMIREAIDRQASFNVIHLKTMVKLDVFMLKATSYDAQAFARARSGVLALEESEREFRFASAEDVVLHKLYWYKLGGEVSERQWNDVLGVLKVQDEALDLEYVKQWADELQVAPFLQRALQEAGRISDSPSIDGKD